MPANDNNRDGKPVRETKISRRQHILQCLANMLEQEPGARITTAALAREVGVSEAALYRHFPSKARMFEGLIEFIEETLFSRTNRIIAEEPQALLQLEMCLTLLLGFAERNPGISRLLTGNALTGETERLHQRVNQVLEKFEMQLRQIVREAEAREGLRPTVTATATANLLMAVAEGRIAQFERSGFKRLPTESWSEQWALIAPHLLYRP
jgi:TetR/AcrR family transcriptional regulator